MIVSNSSTLILLAKAGVLQKFLEEYKKVIIPKQVYEEMIAKSETLDAIEIKKEVDSNRIEIRDTQKSPEKILAEFKLHEGEAAAYSLFQELKAKVLLTDDGELIKLCQITAAPFVCAMAVVVRMYRKKLLTKGEACEYLRKLFDYGRYAEDIYALFKEEVGCT